MSASPFVAEVSIFGFNFAPKGWATCDGQLLPLSQNTALFSLLGTSYGGDGKSTFALPNLGGSAPVHSGQGTGLSLYSLGETTGTETVQLITSEIPLHSHSMMASKSDATDTDPAGLYYAKGIGVGMYAPPGTVTPLAPAAISVAGGDQPHNNMMPFLTLVFCIALQGIYPQRG